MEILRSIIFEAKLCIVCNLELINYELQALVKDKARMQQESIPVGCVPPAFEVVGMGSEGVLSQRGVWS